MGASNPAASRVLVHSGIPNSSGAVAIRRTERTAAIRRHLATLRRQATSESLSWLASGHSRAIRLASCPGEDNPLCDSALADPRVAGVASADLPLQLCL